MNNKKNLQAEAYRIIVGEQLPKPLRHPGEDIRAAKAIFEDRFGEQTFIDVNLWMQFAREVQEYIGAKTLQETAEKLNIQYYKP